MTKATATTAGRTTPKGTTAKKAASKQKSKPELKRLTAEAFNLVNLPEREIEVPELGGSVLIRGFTAAMARKAQDFSSPCIECGDKRHDEEMPHEPRTNGVMDDDMYEQALVKFGVIDPEFTWEDIDKMFNEQFVTIGRRISMSVMAVNLAGGATDLSKLSG